MSTVVVVKKSNKVVIGADTQQSQGDLKIRNVYHTNCDKIIRYGRSYVGTIGSTAINLVLPSLFRRHKELVNLNSADEIFETLVKIHPILKEEYYIETNDSNDEEQEFESNQIFALIANQTGAYDIQSYREVHTIDRFWAIGTGKPFALGAMHAVYKLEKNNNLM